MSQFPMTYSDDAAQPFEGGLDRIQTALLDKMLANVILADSDFRIIYMNEASTQTLQTLEQFLPCRAIEIVGRSIDVFHKHPEHQRRMLADPRNLPHTARIKLGPEAAPALRRASLARTVHCGLVVFVC